MGSEGFVAALCEGLGVPLTIERADVAGRVAARGETVEEAAREVRYECFRRLIAEGRANVVLTAHTLDDQAETVLMKLLRGAWTEGLGGDLAGGGGAGWAGGEAGAGGSAGGVG